MANKKRRKPNTRPRTTTNQRPQARAADAATEATEQRRANGRPAARSPRPAAEPDRGARGDAAAQRTRADKKELARQQREAVRRRIQRQRRMRQGAYAGVIAVAIAVGVFAFTNRNSGSSSASPSPSALPGVLTTKAPWPTNTADVEKRAKAIDLPRHSNQLALHTHTEVQIYVHGQPVTIPANVGIDIPTRYIASIHTHTADGIVHVESSTVADFTLQEFFDIWGVRFTQSCIGGYCDDDANKLQVFQDGKEVTGNFGSVPLADQSVVVITYGTPSEVPNPIPSTFDFSSVA